MLPKTMDNLKNCRIAALVKNGIEVKQLDQFMNNTVAIIWLKISSRGRKTIHLGAIYREHKCIKQPEPNITGNIVEQEAGWEAFIYQWEAASVRADTIVIGDTNLDYNKWNNPVHEYTRMTYMVKNRIEAAGFLQSVRGNTRFWPGANDSLVDQLWTNCPQRIIKLSNVERASSDHNLIEFDLRVAGNPMVAKEILMRDKRGLDIEALKNYIGLLDWSEMLVEENIDVANSIFEEKVTCVFNKHMPLISRQIIS